MGVEFIKEFLRNAPAFIRGRTAGQLVIQTTDFCNAKCPQCGMRVQEKFQRSKLDKETMLAIIDRAAENRVKALSFTGGEPFLFEDTLFDCINYARLKRIPYLRTGTNGFMFMGAERPDFLYRMRQFAQKLKESGLYTFWISLDSWDILEHETGRGLKGVTDGIRRALPVFAEEGVYPSANLGINRTLVRGDIKVNSHSTDAEKQLFYKAYRHGFDKFYSFAASMGFTIANACYPMSMQEGAVYKAESSDDMVTYNDTEKHLLFKALYDTIAEHRSHIRIFTPKSSLLMLIRHYGGETGAGFACYGGIDYFFVNSADGHAYPCGFRVGDDLGRYDKLDTLKIRQKPYCKECDWECFRDPSNQTGVVAELFRSPFKTIGFMFRDRKFMKDWATDILYYFACGMFNFRLSPRYDRMRRFSKN
ncbi:MAG: radical SAM protein [Deferribacterales bacterium]